MSKASREHGRRGENGQRVQTVRLLERPPKATYTTVCRSVPAGAWSALTTALKTPDVRRLLQSLVVFAGDGIDSGELTPRQARAYDYFDALPSDRLIETLSDYLSERGEIDETTDDEAATDDEAVTDDETRPPMTRARARAASAVA